LAALGMSSTRGVSLIVTVRTLASADPDSMLLELTATSWGRPLGTRQLRVKATDCAALPRGFGDVIARMSYDATAQDTGRRLLPPAPPRFQVQTSPPAEAAGPRDYIALGIGAGVVAGMLPSAALGLQLQAATVNYPISLRLKLGMLWPQRHIVPEGAVQAHAYDLSLEMCPSYRLPSWERLTLRICVGPDMGVVQAEGEGFAAATGSFTRPFLYFGLAPEVSLRLTGATWLHLGGGVALGIVRPHVLLGVDSERRSIDLPELSAVREQITAGIVQIL
jgi:hypothetical protein